jgi:uncharacterized membrane protein YsdA (DUF1294 family)/cold shock CspA family protein
MAQQGELIEWNDERGFGFIRPDDGGPRVFVHISQIGRIATRPRAGDRVSFAIGPGRDGTSAALNVKIPGANPFKARSLSRGVDVAAPRHHPIRAYLGLALLATLGFGWLAGSVPPALVALYLVLGLVSAWLYYSDKQKAEAGQWRTSEATLHGFDLASGIVGGLFAQQLFRHKTAKPGFAATTYVIAAIHALWLVGIVSGRIPPGALAALIPR